MANSQAAALFYRALARYARGHERVASPVLTITLVLCLAGCPSRPPPTSRISAGHVTDQTGVPVAGARVEVNGSGTVTDASGDFFVVAGPGKRTILSISHPDFADFSHVSRTPLVKQTWRLVR